MKHERRVPLFRRALDILDAARTLDGGDNPLVFPGIGSKMLHDMVLSGLLKRLKVEAVPHGSGRPSGGARQESEGIPFRGIGQGLIGRQFCQWMDCQHEDPIMPDEQIAALERQHAHLRSQFASIGEMRSGSLTERFRPCGKPRCHCAKPGDPGHGPVLSLTRKQAGKTVTRIIPAHAGSETQARLAEYRRFRQLSKMFIKVNDALSEARLATGSAAKKSRRPR